MGIGLSIVMMANYRGPLVFPEKLTLIVDENGPSCGCGNRGFLEVYKSIAAIISNAKNFI